MHNYVYVNIMINNCVMVKVKYPKSNTWIIIGNIFIFLKTIVPNDWKQVNAKICNLINELESVPSTVENNVWYVLEAFALHWSNIDHSKQTLERNVGVNIETVEPNRKHEVGPNEISQARWHNNIISENM